MAGASDSDDSSDLAEDFGYDDDSDGDSSLDYARYGRRLYGRQELVTGPLIKRLRIVRIPIRRRRRGRYRC